MERQEIFALIVLLLLLLRGARRLDRRAAAQGEPAVLPLVLAVIPGLAFYLIFAWDNAALIAYGMAAAALYYLYYRYAKKKRGNNQHP